MGILISCAGTYPCGRNDTRGDRLVYKRGIGFKESRERPRCYSGVYEPDRFSVGRGCHPRTFQYRKGQADTFGGLKHGRGPYRLWETGKRAGTTGGKREKTLYQVNLNSGYDLYASPVYYLQQNDIVYVEPNSMKARQATVNGNNVRSASFWMSLASLLTTITVLIVK